MQDNLIPAEFLNCSLSFYVQMFAVYCYAIKLTAHLVYANDLMI